MADTHSIGKSPAGTSDLLTRIRSANLLCEVLNLAESPHLAKEDATEIVSKISDWLVINVIEIDDFKYDNRFKLICDKLDQSSETILKDLSDALRSGVLLDKLTDEQVADSMYAGLSLEENLLLLSDFVEEKSRNAPALRAIAKKIITHRRSLTLKECSDVYFAMGSLNFIDEALLRKIGGDVMQQLNSSAVPGVVSSIIVSLGMLRYRDASLLNALTRWLIRYYPNRHYPLLLTLASVNFPTEYAADIQSKIMPCMRQHQMKRGEWLNYVWALCVLGFQQPYHLESILK